MPTQHEDGKTQRQNDADPNEYLDPAGLAGGDARNYMTCLS